MSEKILRVPFSYRDANTFLSPVLDLSPVTIIADLLRYGFHEIDLYDLPGTYAELCQAKEHGVTLWVDHDAKYLVESYLALEEMLSHGKSGKHYSFLNDGALEITGVFDGNNVEVQINRCPGLNVAFRSTYTTIVSLIVYTNTWREMAAILRRYQS